jgi:hypothetical protein
MRSYISSRPCRLHGGSGTTHIHYKDQLVRRLGKKRVSLLCESYKTLLYTLPGPYYPLDTIGTVPRAYDMFKAYEGMEGRKNK